MGSGAERWDFFISYDESDEAWAEWCAWHLEAAGCSVLLEKWDFLPGGFPTAQRDAGVQHSERVLALLSPAYLRVGLPLATHAPLNEGRLVPIRVADWTVPGLLAGVTCIDLVGLSESEARAGLLEWAQNRNTGRLKPDTPPVFPGMFPRGRPRSGAMPAFPGRPAGRSTDSSSAWLVAVGDDLAREVGQQLPPASDGASLPVRWRVANPRFFDGRAGTLVAGPDGRVGGPGPADLLRQIPSGRLVVLGEAGAGKSRLLRSIARDLLRRREQQGGGAIPVLVPLSSWNPDRSFQGWLEDELYGYPALQRRRKAGVARQLIEQRQLLPLLDGLDEMPPAARSRALAAIGSWQQPGQALVLASRVQEYEHAVDPVHEGGGYIRGAAGIELCPLEVDDAVRWLTEIPGSRSQRGWAPVVERLRAEPDGPLARTFASPLMLTLAREAWTAAPGAARQRNPRDLLDLPDEHSLRARLFDDFLREAYRSRHAAEPDQARAVDESEDDDAASRARGWLAFLAGQLEQNNGGRPEIGWWRLPSAVPRQERVLLLLLGAGILWSVLMAGVLVMSLILFTLRREIEMPGYLRWPGVVVPIGLFGFLAIVVSSVFGSGDGLRTWDEAAPVGVGRRPRRSSQRARLERLGLRRHALGRLLRWTWKSAVSGAAVFIVALVGPPEDRRRGLESAEGLHLAGASAVLTAVVLLWLRSIRSASAPGRYATASPDAALARDRRAFISIMIRFAAGWGICVATVLALPTVLWTNEALSDVAVAAGVLGFLIGLPAGAAAAAARTSWARYQVCRLWLAWRGHLPRDPMAFLADARRRGVVRQAGAAYQFRHIELQRYVAPAQDHPGADRLARQEAVELARRQPEGPLFELGWEPAVGDLLQDWADLVQIARAWHPPEAARAGWAAASTELAGRGCHLAGVLAQVPTGRLVLLGPEGSGRTSLLVALALELLADRRPNRPVPVLLSPCTWNPDRQDFADWLVSELRRRHTWLAATRAEVSGARDLVARRLVLPLLDRLEDMPPALRAGAVAGLNAWLADGENGAGLVLSTDEATFRAALSSDGTGEAHLDGAMAVRLLPLDLDQAEHYLTGAAGGHLAADWRDLLDLAARRPASTAGLALRSPLLLSLLRDTYLSDPDVLAPLPGDPPEVSTGGEPPSGGPRPHEEQHQEEPPRREERSARLPLIRDRLVAMSLASAYAPPTRQEPAGACMPCGRAPVPGHALAALGQVTHGLSRSPGLAAIPWWEIQCMVPRTVVCAPLAVAGLGLGLSLALALGDWQQMPIGLGVAALGVLLADPRRADLRVPRPVAFRLPGGARRERGDDDTAGCGPRAVWYRSRAHARHTAPLLLAPYPSGIAYYLQSVLVGGATDVSWWAVIAAGSAVCGWAGAFGLTAWGRYTVSRLWLTWKHGLPADLMAVLEDAQTRGVLVVAGDTWEFRQDAVRRYLAAGGGVVVGKRRCRGRGTMAGAEVPIAEDGDRPETGHRPFRSAWSSRSRVAGGSVGRGRLLRAGTGQGADLHLGVLLRIVRLPRRD